MALNVPNETDRTIETMLRPAQAKMQELGAAVSGAGPEAAAAYKSMSSFASGQPDVARQAAESILTLRADETLPHPHRLLEGNARHAAAKTLLEKLNTGAHAAHSQLESALTTALLPAPHRDPAQRLLVRDEIRTRYSRLDGQALVGAVTKSLGTNELHDAEILGPFGSALLESAGAAPAQLSALRVAAAEKYLTSTTGSRQQVSARKAISTLRDLNIKGQLAAFQQAARMTLSKVD